MDIIKWSTISALAVIFVIGLLINNRFRYYNSITDLSQEVDHYLENSLNFEKTHKVYDGILKILNKKNNFFIYDPEFKGIICFKSNNEEIELVNSSDFIWEYEINHDDFFNEESSGLVKRVDLKINGKLNNKKNIVISIGEGNTNYIFVIIFKENHDPISLFDIYFENILRPTLNRVVKLIQLERNMNEREKNSLKKMKDRFFYLQNAVKAMHHIKNRATPLSNFIEMSDDFIAGNMDAEEEEIYKNELQRVKTNFKDIIERSNYILKSPANPFKPEHLKEKSVKFVFSNLRTVWSDFFDISKLHIKSDLKDLEQKKTQLNVDGINIVFSDWISNMNKHSSGNEKVILEEKNKKLSIVFSNSVSKSDIEDLRNLIADFNSDNRGEILKRNSYGLVIMKNLLELMDVKGKMSLDENTITFSLLFSIKDEVEN